MQIPVSWRERLGEVIQNPQERQRIANELSINPLTLTRWVNNQSKPRPRNLQQLLNALPQYRNELTESFALEFPDFALDEKDRVRVDQPLEIPSEFYERVLATYITTPISQRFWTLGTLILEQALGQLDPNHLGMAITVLQCMPPSHGKKVHSLRKRMGRGTPPWSFYLDEETLFLGAESLAGYAVNSCRPAIVQNPDQRGRFPVHKAEWEKSAAAYSIMQMNASAGCLLVSSTQPDYFLPSRQALLQNYAALIALAFEPGEFYPIQDIDLRLMPFYRTQQKHIANFRQRVSGVLLEAQRTEQSLSILEAEQVVWQQVEEELLLMPPYIEDGSVSKEPVQQKELIYDNTDESFNPISG